MNYLRSWAARLGQENAMLVGLLILLLLLTGCGGKPPEPVTRVQLVEQKVALDLTARTPAPLPPRRADYRSADTYNAALARYVAAAYVANAQCGGQLEDIEALHGPAARAINNEVTP